MPNRVLTAARQELLEALPHAIHRAMESYTHYASHHQADSEDPKAYAAHHAGLKAAISHLDALIKLGRLIVNEQQDDMAVIDAEADPLPSLIQKAQAALVVLDHESPSALSMTDVTNE